MKVNTNELRVLIDVDKTLITDIVTSFQSGYRPFNYYGSPVFASPIEKHIDLLKSYKTRGYEVVVNSANGFGWAKEVITKLDLIPYVDEVATKPLKYVDDKEWDSFCSRVYIDG